MPCVHLMDNPVRNYAWGSLTALAELAGRPPSGEPEAELWMGAHPGNPSLVGGRSLGEHVAEDPQRVLGPALVRRSGTHLPFLVKLLGVAVPLSLQVHPSEEQAREGFAAEEQLGVPWNSPLRSYRDPFAKPELVVAVTAFDAMCGFRRAAQARGLVVDLAVPRLAPLATDLGADDPASALRAAFTRLVTWPEPERRALVEEVAAAASVRAAGGPVPYGWVVELAGRYPADPGTLAPLLLSTLRLQPGEGLLLEPGVPHAYLHGTAVEVMGASDNVLRAGLTPKHVDVDGLLRTVRVDPEPVPVLRPVRSGREEVWPSPGVTDFRLSRVTVAAGEEVVLDRRGPQVLLCLEGALRVGDGSAEVALPRGASAFVEATAPRVVLTGAGVAFRATAGDPV